MDALTIFLIVLACVVYILIGLFSWGFISKAWCDETGFFMIIIWPVVLILYLLIKYVLWSVFQLGEAARKRWDDRK